MCVWTEEGKLVLSGAGEERGSRERERLGERERKRVRERERCIGALRAGRLV